MARSLLNIISVWVRVELGRLRLVVIWVWLSEMLKKWWVFCRLSSGSINVGVLYRVD